MFGARLVYIHRYSTYIVESRVCTLAVAIILIGSDFTYLHYLGTGNRYHSYLTARLIVPNSLAKTLVLAGLGT